MDKVLAAEESAAKVQVQTHLHGSGLYLGLRGAVISVFASFVHFCLNTLHQEVSSQCHLLSSKN